VGGGDRLREDLSRRRDAERSKNVDAFGKVFFEVVDVSSIRKKHFFWGEGTWIWFQSCSLL
jgi:hypothetical protein